MSARLKISLLTSNLLGYILLFCSDRSEQRHRRYRSSRGVADSTHGVAAVAFSRDGRILVSGGTVDGYSRPFPSPILLVCNLFVEWTDKHICNLLHHFPSPKMAQVGEVLGCTNAWNPLGRFWGILWVLTPSVASVFCGTWIGGSCTS